MVARRRNRWRGGTARGGCWAHGRDGSRGQREDKSGEALVEMLTAMGAHIVAKEILADDLEPLAGLVLVSATILLKQPVELSNARRLDSPKPCAFKL